MNDSPQPFSPTITGKTHLLGIIGDPIEHVMSPLMHNQVFHEHNLDYIYIPFHVTANDLEKVIQGLQNTNLEGFNVTIPHKVAIIPLLDELDPLAAQIGAVNTVKIEDGHLIGKNTDSEGAIKSLVDNHVELENRRITILGSGGAARAIVFGLVTHSSNITIINRSRPSMDALILDVKQATKVELSGEYFGNADSVRSIMQNTDLLINTTPLGMSPQIRESPIPASWLHPEMTVFDIIYRPMMTQLMRDAKSQGCKILGGLEMLVNQGALAFEWWTQHLADYKLMKSVVSEYLTNH
ncbi:MAG: shikimate dehydrogenase [Promethearchaeota archaeon]